MIEAKAGDVILFEKLPGFNVLDFFPFVIRLICGNKVVHCGIVQGTTPDSIFYWDSNPGGVKLRELTRNNVSSNGLLGTHISSPNFVTTTSEKVANWGSVWNHSPYGYRRILDIAIYHGIKVFNREYAPVNPPMGLGDLDSSICSDFVARWLINANQGPWTDEPEWLIQPDHYLDPKYFTVRPLIWE